MATETPSPEAGSTPNPGDNKPAAADEKQTDLNKENVPSAAGPQDGSAASAKDNGTKDASADKAAAPAGGEKKLSGAELKAKAKADKAARRAQLKTAAPAAGGPAGGAASSTSQAGGDSKGGGKGKGKQEAPQNNNSSAAKGQQPNKQHHQTTAATSTSAAMADTKPEDLIPEIYSHLSIAKRAKTTDADKDVHPDVLLLGQKMGSFTISDSMSRLEMTLLAFKKVINSYTTPHGTTFSRHFTSHVLNPQVEYLTACRPMCFSMGNAVRWLKLQVSKIDIDLPDTDAKKLLCESIDNFIRERVTLASEVIVDSAADLVEEGSTILTYGQHLLVERALIRARVEQGKSFSVIVLDDAFEPTGKVLVENLQVAEAKAAHEARSTGGKMNGNLAITYSQTLGAVHHCMKRSTTVLIGAEAMFSNGAMYARCGSADIALFASDLGVPYIALSASVNFTERVAMDSLTYNEIDPDRCTAASFRLLFDVTQDKHLTAVVTELGNTAPSSVAAILRKLEEL